MFYGVKFNVDGIGEWIVLIFDIVVNFVCFSDIVVDSFIIGIVYLFYLDWNQVGAIVIDMDYVVVEYQI